MSALPPYATSDSLTQQRVTHGFFTRRGGVSAGLYASLNCGPGSQDIRTHVLENRRRVVVALGVPDAPLLTCYQVHGAEVVEVTQPWEIGQAPQADGMVTTQKHLALGILTADCAPVLFADVRAGVIGAAHAGWKGARRGILAATVDAMEALGASCGCIVAAIGPAIAQASYEVGEELRQELLAEAAGNAEYFVANAAGRWQFDLAAYVVSKLAARGVGQINLLAKDTFSRKDDYFSYRRTTKAAEPDYGRHISVIVRQE